MKKFIRLKRAIAICTLLVSITACTDKQKEAEANEEDKVGKVYNADEQGIDIENRDNQFPVTRNNNVEGEGLETGAPTDTIDGDGDKAIGNSQKRQ